MRAARATLLTSILLSGCSGHGPKPCLGPGVCGQGTECLANRCLPAGALPADGRTRIVRQARALAVGGGKTSSATLPVAVTLGGQASDRTLYLAFEPIGDATRIESAFLIFEPMPDTLASTEDIELSVWRVLEPWQRDTLTVNRQPRLGLPASRGIARARPPLPIRIDVTELVRYAEKHPMKMHGYALKAEDRKSFGVSVATGLSGARGPRLEVYLEGTKLTPERR